MCVAGVAFAGAAFGSSAEGLWAPSCEGETPRKDLDDVLSAVLAKGGRIVFSADYPDIDAEYRDVRRVEALK